MYVWGNQEERIWWSM